MTRKKQRHFKYNFIVPRHKKDPFDPERRKLDYEFRLRMESLSRKKGECHEVDPNSGVVFLKNFPHAFAELPMKKFFSQFGRIKRLRISRSRKTGKSKGFAYIEFEYEEVAKIVAETMNNYLMFRQLMKCEFVPKEKLHPETFKGCFQKSFKPLSRRIAIRKTNRYLNAAPAQVCKQLQKGAKKEARKQKMLAEMGIDFEITGHYRDEYANVKSKLEKRDQARELDNEAVKAKALEDINKGTEKSDDSEKEDLKSDDSEEGDLKGDDYEMEIAEESMEDEMTSREQNKRKMEMDRDEAIDKARKVQKKMKHATKSKGVVLNEAVDKARKFETEMQNRAESESESEEDAESSRDSESDVSTEEEEPETEEKPSEKKAFAKFKTPETNKKSVGTPGSKKQRLMEQESDSVEKTLVSKGHINADKVTPFKGGKSVMKGTPKSIGKKPVRRKSLKRDNNISPPKGQKPTLEQTSNSTSKKSTRKLKSDLVTPVKEANAPKQRFAKSTGKKSASEKRLRNEVVTPVTQRPVKKTSKSTSKKEMIKRTRTDTVTPLKGQRLQKTARSTGKKDMSKKRLSTSS